MEYVALRLFIFCLFHLCIQGNQVNTEVLAQMIRYFDDKLQPTFNNRPNQYSVVIRVPYQECTDKFSLDTVFNSDKVKKEFSNFKTKSPKFYEVNKDSVFAAPQRILLICLLHCCTFAVDQTVNPTTLMNIVNNFENQLFAMGQYAVAFRVEKNKCQDSNYGGADLITEQVKEKLRLNQVYTVVHMDGNKLMVCVKGIEAVTELNGDTIINILTFDWHCLQEKQQTHL
ncbi:hypothetical protein QQF64_009005 [Cirrhinus molitorella]|uniref:Uncharacterized protein n=1 Tax=Cirrhinus molitorella TaxID=172907 RepID=A0ABR3M7T0_9TELE